MLTMNYHRLTCLIEKGPDIDAGGFRQLHWDPRGDGRGADGKVDWENTDTLLAMSDILLRPLQESEAVSLARTTARPRGGKRKSLGRLIWTTVQSKLIPNPWFGLSRSFRTSHYSWAEINKSGKQLTDYHGLTCTWDTKLHRKTQLVISDW